MPTPAVVETSSDRDDPPEPAPVRLAVYYDPALHPLTAPSVGEITFPDGHRAFYDRAVSKDYDNWFRKTFPTWERETFAAFRALIRPSTTFIGFGEWIGPTVLYAAQIAKRSYALEPDPKPFEALVRNVLANPSFSDRVTCSPLCIGPRTGQMVMYGAGGSGSFIDELVAGNSTVNYKRKYPQFSFSVDCVRLPLYIREHHIPTDDLFLKIDTEGAEWSIISSLYDWFASLPQKPTIHLSVHGNNVRAQMLPQFVKTLRLFRHVIILRSEKDLTAISAPRITEELMNAQCRQCALIVTDRDLPLAD